VAEQDSRPGEPAGRERVGGGRDRAGLAQESLAAARARAHAQGFRPAGSRPRQPVDQARPAVDDAGAAADGDFDVSGDQDAVGRQEGCQEGCQEGRQGLSTAPVRRNPLRRVRRDDPQPLAAAIDGLLDSEGWTMAAATGSVFGRWAQIVGPELAEHTQPEALHDGELTVVADSTAWATQLRLLAAQLVRRLNAELGTGAVQRVKVRGPFTATRRPGEWRVRGSRGPRDTYG
jgi:predicted nucleic acid-binding Zn ribbon protein